MSVFVCLSVSNCMSLGFSVCVISAHFIHIFLSFSVSAFVSLSVSLPLFEPEQMLELERIVNCYLWKKPFSHKNPRSRIKTSVIYQSIGNGGFGHIRIEHIIAGIRTKQLLKMTNPEYDHPLFALTVSEATPIQYSRKLKQYADEVAISAHTLIRNNFLKRVQGITAEELCTNLSLANVIRNIHILDVTKPSKVETNAFNELVHIEGCETFGDLLHTLNKVPKIRLILKKGWLRLFNEMYDTWQPQIEDTAELYLTKDFKNKIAFKMHSKELRLDIFTQQDITKSKLDQLVEDKIAKAHFDKIRKLASTKHKNVALRIWNGDILSRDRLCHMGLVQNNLCFFCNQVETQLHVVKECNRAKELWNKLNLFTGKQSSGDQDWCGLGDSLDELELRLECQWHLLNSKDLDADNIFIRSVNFIESLRQFKNNGHGDLHINTLL